MQMTPRATHSPFEDLGITPGPVDSVGVESCSIEKETKSSLLPHPVVEAWFGGERFEAIVDTGCSHTFIQDTLAPDKYARKATLVKMMCMHGHGTYYTQKIYQVIVLKTTQKMPVGVACNLPYPVILGWDWKEIYEVLNVIKNNRLGEVSLLGSEEDDPVGESFDVEQLVCSKAF